MASTRQRAGKFTGLYRDKDGAQRSAGTYRDEKTALRQATAAEALEAAGLDGSAVLRREEKVYPEKKRGELTVAGYAPRWMKLLYDLEPTSRESYEYMLKHIIRKLGTAAVASLDKPRVKQFFAELAGEGMCAATRGHVLTVLRGLCKSAVDDGLLAGDPTSDIRIKGRRSREMRILTIAEYARLLAAVDPHYKLMTEALVHTGMRFGEALGLQARDIRPDEDSGGYVIKIRRVVIEVAGKTSVRDYGKTAGSSRDITIGKDLGSRLIEAGSGNSEGWCFRAHRGGAIQRSNFRRIWLLALAGAGLSGIRVHDLRHTHASWLLDNGASLVEVRDRLGHGNIKTTSRYLHVVDKTGCLDALSRALAA